MARGASTTGGRRSILAEEIKLRGVSSPFRSAACRFAAGDDGIDHAVAEACAKALSGLGVARLQEHLAVGALGDGVAAPEDAGGPADSEGAIERGEGRAAPAEIHLPGAKE